MITCKVVQKFTSAQADCFKGHIAAICITTKYTYNYTNPEEENNFINSPMINDNTYTL